jgi:hypothetical protein
MMFSERMGHTKQKILQFKEIDADLRNSLWNACRGRFFDSSQFFLNRDEHLEANAKLVWVYFFKKPVDEIPADKGRLQSVMLSFFQTEQWHRVYDFIEFADEWLARGIEEEFRSIVNYMLEREKAGYRLLDGHVTPITDAHELAEIASASERTGDFVRAARHIRAGIALYSDRKKPDYRNSVKEAISAVEAAAQAVSGNNKASLDDAIKAIDKAHGMHSAFKAAIGKFYGFTSDSGGIRHCLTESTVEVDEIDARYMLISCSAFVNFLAMRYAGIRS